MKLFFFFASLLAAAAQTTYNVTVTWDANPATDLIAGYKLYYARLPTTAWPTNWSSTNTTTNTGTVSLAPGKWAFVATAVNAAGESLPSLQVTTSPAATSPVGFTQATGGSLSNSIVMSWRPNLATENVSTYALWWALNATSGWPTNWNKVIVGGTNYTMSGLAPGDYSFTLAGRNSWNEGPTNGTFVVTVGSLAPPIPSQVKGIKITVTQQQTIIP